MVELKSAELTVKIKNAGAELVSVKNNEGLEFLWQAKPEVWPRHAPVLFPIVGKLRDNKYQVNATWYELSQHGFARDLEFACLSKNKSNCEFVLHSSDDTLKKYPFDFVFKIKYRLEGNSLYCAYEVSNPGNTEMIFGVGAHPGFNCPLLPHELFEDYFLEFEKSEYDLTLLENGLRKTQTVPLNLPQNRLPLTDHLFDNDALVFENRQINTLSLRSGKSSHQVRVYSKDWPFYGVWSKKGCREFVCLEPWYSITDKTSATGKLSDKDGMIALQPGKTFSCEFSMSFS